MRSFKDFKSEANKVAQIQEDVVGGDISLAGNARVGPMDGPISADDVEVGAHNVHDPSVLDRINSFVGAMGDKPYINPYYAINRLWTKLQTIGISFNVDDVKFEDEKGKISLPLSQYGGRYGFVDMDGIVKQDDGISGRLPGGLNLVITYVKIKGLVTMEAQIEHGKEPAVKLVGEAEEIDEVSFSSLFGGSPDRADGDFIDVNGKSASAPKGDITSAMKAKLIKIDTSGRQTQISLMSGRSTYDALKKYLERKRPSGEVVLHLANASGKLYHSLKFADWKKASAHLDFGDSSGISAELPSRLIRFGSRTGNNN